MLGELCRTFFRRAELGLLVPDAKLQSGRITRIVALRNEPGLIAHECSACGYVTSVILPAGKQANDDAL
jgi:hypothetical protein